MFFIIIVLGPEGSFLGLVYSIILSLVLIVSAAVKEIRIQDETQQNGLQRDAVQGGGVRGGQAGADQPDREEV